VDEKKSGDTCDAARSNSIGSDRSNSISEITSSTAQRPRFVITFTPAPGADAVRGLRSLLKAAKRRFGLIATDAFEDRSSALEISNRAADEFRELAGRTWPPHCSDLTAKGRGEGAADEIIAERARTWRRR
jgi:hypothetical protein